MSTLLKIFVHIDLLWVSIMPKGYYIIVLIQSEKIIFLGHMYFFSIGTSTSKIIIMANPIQNVFAESTIFPFF